MVPRLVVSAFKGMSGKTIVTLAILRGLRKRGLRVAPFKVGPDYIDPSYHRWASGRPSRNLDVVLMGEEGVVRRFVRHSANADVAVVEGVLGLYDSVDGVTELGSTAQVAKLLKAPVVLVLNGERINRTLRAVVRGLKAFDPLVQIPAVVLTNVAPRQAEKLAKSLPEEGVDIVGVVPKSRAVSEAFSYRHLGLVPVDERGDYPTLEEVLDNYVEPYIDFDRLMEIAKSAEELDVAVAEEDPPPKAGCRIGVVLDSAFNFYYPKLIEEAEALGEVVYLSAVRDGSLPPLDLLVVGGGFPEVLAEKLERNKSFRKAVLDYVERGGRAYAECGGFMYLTSSIVIDRSEYEMVGAIDAVTYMLERPVGKGYAWGTVVGKTPVAPVGAALRGHEFHYSKMAFREKVQPVIKLDRGVGIGGGWDGVVKKNLHAQYMHLHPYTYSVLRALCRST